MQSIRLSFSAVITNSILALACTSINENKLEMKRSPILNLWNLREDPEFIRYAAAHIKATRRIIDGEEHPSDLEKYMYKSVLDSENTTDQSQISNAVNCMTILVASGRSFSGETLPIQVPGASLRNGIFDSVNFKDADLQGCDFTNSYIRGSEIDIRSVKGSSFSRKPDILGNKKTILSIKTLKNLEIKNLKTHLGSSIAVSKSDGTINFYLTSNNQNVVFLKDLGKNPRYLSISPHEDCIAFLSDSGPQIWSICEGKKLVDSSNFNFEDDNEKPIFLCFHKDWSLLAYVFSVLDILYLNVYELKFCEEPRMKESLPKIDINLLNFRINLQQKNLSSFEFVNKSSTIFYSVGNRKILFRIVIDAEIPVIRETGYDNVDHIASSDKNLALGYATGDIAVLDVDTMRLLYVINSVHKGGITNLFFSHSGRALLSTGEDCFCKEFDSKNGKELHILKGHKSSISAAAFTVDDDHLYTGSTDGIVKTWILNATQSLQKLEMTDVEGNLLVPIFDNEIHGRLRRRTALLRGVKDAYPNRQYSGITAISDDMSWFAYYCLSPKKIFFLHSTNNSDYLENGVIDLQQNNKECLQLKFSPKNDHLAIFCDKEVFIMKLLENSYKLSKHIMHQKGNRVLSGDFSNNSEYFAISYYGLSCVSLESILPNRRKLDFISIFEESPSFIKNLGGNYLTVASSEGKINIYDSNRDINVLKATLQGHTIPVKDILFLPGKLLALYADNSIKEWKLIADKYLLIKSYSSRENPFIADDLFLHKVFSPKELSIFNINEEDDEKFNVKYLHQSRVNAIYSAKRRARKKAEEYNKWFSQRYKDKLYKAPLSNNLSAALLVSQSEALSYRAFKEEDSICEIF